MNFETLAEQLSIEIVKPGEHHHARTGWINLDCPRCSPESKRYRLGYNTHFGYMNCWTCGQVPLAAALVEASGKSLQEVLPLLKQIKKQPPTHAHEPTVQGKLIMPSGCGKLKQAHIRYLHRRGFYDTDQLQQLWNIKGTGAASTLPWRIIMPIDYRSKTVSWLARAIGDASPRYLSAAPHEERIPRRELLYGLDYVRHACIIVEGPTDVWAIGPGAVAICGLIVSRAQIKLLMRIRKRIICFDNEPVAQQRASELADMLAVFHGETIIAELESAKDAATASKKEIKQLRQLLD